ncbi:MAG: hypothetical protein RL722_34 [Pseudomonadota bacterium]|jgi:hypothetical protein
MMPSLSRTAQSTLSAPLLALVLAAGFCLPAQAQFSPLPEAKSQGTPAASAAANDKDYRKAMSQHLYGAYPGLVHKGKLPPMLVGVTIVNTTIDAQGQVTAVDVVRAPALKEVQPWVEHMIRAAGPYPAPAKLAAPVTWREIFLVTNKGRFQVDALTEGQASK